MKLPRRVRILLDDVRFRVAAAVILGALPAAAIIIWTTIDISRELERQAFHEMAHEARSLSSRVNGMFESVRRGLSSQARVSTVQRRLKPECDDILRALVTRQLWLKSAWVANTEGIVECSDRAATPPPNRSGSRDFIEVMATGLPAVGDGQRGPETGHAVIPMSVPIADDGGRLLGVLGAAVDIAGGNTIVEGSVFLPDPLVTIVSDDLTVMFRNVAPERYVGRKLEWDNVAGQLADRSVISFRAVGSDGVNRIYGTARLPSLGLTVLIGVPARGVLAESRAWAQSALLAIGVSAAFSLILLVALLRRLVVRPVDSLVTAASNLGAGSGTARIGSRMIGGQLGKLANTFDAMADQIDARERALRESKDHLHAIMENSVDGLITIDDRGIVLSFSGPAERIFGYSADEVVGHNVCMLMPEPYQTEHDGYLADYLSTGRGKVIGAGREVEGRRKDGSVFPMDIAVGELPTIGGRRQFVGTVRDITERKAIENQLRQAQKMEAIGQLTGGIAHDFNNLLAVIMGNLELLDDRLPRTDPGRKLVDVALHATARGADLTRRLLAFSRQQPLRPVQVAVNELVRGTIDLLSRALGEAVKIETRLGDDAGDALVDSSQFENALLNLALNARDAMPKGGRLLIETRRTVLDEDNAVAWKNLKAGPYVLISVSDTGVGMTPEVAARAFEPFFTTKDVGKGTGLGLSMVYGFAKQSDGHVGIYSEPRRGTTVRIYLPQADGKSVAAVPSPAAGHAPPGGGERVLVVEDNDDVRRLVVHQLTDLGYQVEAAANGRQAAEYLRSAAFIDLLISDVVLPDGMSGAEVAAAARQLRPSLPVLYMSGYTEGIIKGERMTAEGSALLPKPFTKTQLSVAIDQVLRQKKTNA